MKPISMAVLLLLVFSSVPLAHVSPRSDAPVPSLMTLDVCAAAGSAIHAGVDLPFLCENPVKSLPEISSALHEIAGLPFQLSLFSLQFERPPESRAIFRSCL
jgi:hypothetical protein